MQKIPAISLIGVSGFGEVHYTNFLQFHRENRLRIVAVTVINREQEEEKCRVLESIGCRVFTSTDEMFAGIYGQCDLCVIPTGIHLHATMTTAALAAGCNVLVEKPAAATIQEVFAMQEAERKSDRFVAVGFQKLYAPETLAIKQAILDGCIGRITSIRCRGLWPRPQSYYNRNQWAGKLRFNDAYVLDSPFNNAFAHEVAMACFLAGRELFAAAELKSIEAELYRAREIESCDTACFRIITASGLPLSFFFSHACQVAEDPEILITGENGEIQWGYDSLKLSGGAEKLQISLLSPQAIREAMMNALLEKIHNPSRFVCNLQIAAAHTICVNAANESSGVTRIPSHFITTPEINGSIQPSIENIQGLVARCFEKNALFSESDIPWSQPGKALPIHDYRSFPSRNALPT